MSAIAQQPVAIAIEADQKDFQVQNYPLLSARTLAVFLFLMSHSTVYDLAYEAINVC